MALSISFPSGPSEAITRVVKNTSRLCQAAWNAYTSAYERMPEEWQFAITSESLQIWVERLLTNYFSSYSNSGFNHIPNA